MEVSHEAQIVLHRIMIINANLNEEETNNVSILTS
jgi:hypothetical protein